MKNKYAELFTAKLNDMDLVLFERHRDWGKWALAGDSGGYFMVSNNFEYFLCLPQHKDACLHWLNGGKSQVEYTQASYLYWCDIDSDESNWSEGHIFMDKNLNIRIKPKKEKRWIGVYKNGATTDACLLRKEAENHPMITDVSVNDWQFIEIEVEV